MDATPHTHTVKIRRPYNGSYMFVEYGDTKVWIRFSRNRDPAAWRIRRAVKRAIRCHDKGSVKAGKQRAFITSLRQEFNYKDEPSEQWASKSL